MQTLEKLDLSKENLIESLIKSMPGLFILFDKEGRIHWWNSRLEHYSGYTAEQIRGLKVLEFLDEHNKKAVEKKIEETFQKGEADVEIQTKTSEGNIQVFLLTGVSMELQGGNFIIATGIDITSKEQERLKKIIDEKNILLKEVHHRVKNNLTIISGLLSMQSDQIEDEHTKNLFQESISRVNSMSMIHEMLYEQGDFSNIDFKSYLKKLIEQLTSMYQTQSIKVETEIDDHIYFDVNKGILVP